MKIIEGLAIAIAGLTAALVLNYAAGWTAETWQHWVFVWPVAVIAGLAGGARIARYWVG